MRTLRVLKVQLPTLPKKIINNESGLVQSGVSIIGNFIATGFSAVAIILISRILGPEKFGIFSVGFSIVLIITRLNDVGLNASIVKFASKEDNKTNQNYIYSLTLKYKLVISTVILALGLIFAERLAKLINFENVFIIRMAFTIGLFTAYYEQLLFMLQSLHRFNQVVFINWMQACTKLISAIVILFSKNNLVWPIFATYIAAPIVPVLFSRKLLPAWVKTNIFNFENNFALKKKILSFTKHSSIALISAGIIENIDVLFLQKHLNLFETGLYGGVSRIAMMFSLVAYSLGNVLNPRVARYKSKKDLSVYLKKAWMLAGISLLAFLVLTPFSKFLILLTIGSEYISGNTVLLLLTGSSFLAIASIPFIATFYSFDSNWYFSVSGILQLIIVLVGNFLYVPIYGLEAAAWTRIVARLSLFLFSSIAAIMIFKKKYEEAR